MNARQSRGDTASNVAGNALLERLSLALVQEPRPDIIVRAALNALVSEIGAASAAVFFADLDARVSHLVAQVNYPDDVVAELQDVSLDVPAISNQAIKSGEVVTATSQPADDGSPEVRYTQTLAERMGMRTAAAVPLIAGGRTLGVLVYSLAEAHVFDDAEIHLLREVGDRIAAALNRARLEDELDRRAEETALLHSIATAAAGEDDLHRILAATLEHLSSLIRFTGGSIALVEGDELVIRASAGVFADVALGQRLARGRGLSWQIVESADPFMSNDLLAVGHHGKSQKEDKVVRSYLAVPLVWRDQPFGLLQVDSFEPHAFRPPDLPLLQAVAALLSGPIELARRYQAEVQLRRDLSQAKGRLEAILGTAPMGVIFFDSDGCLAYANAASYETLNLLPHEELLLERSWDDLIQTILQRRWKGDTDALRAIVTETRALRSGVLVHDFPLHSPDQTFLRIAAPVIEEGSFTGHVIILIDVTEERRALAEAERSVSLRDRFISIASHELKTPLTSIKGAAQLLQRMQRAAILDDERAQRHVATIASQAERIRQLVDELLDVSRIQSGRIELRLEPLDLATLVEDVISTLPDDQRARIDLDTTPAPVQGDPLRLEQVTLNLLDNALKYSGNDTQVVVYVSSVNGGVVLSVADQGIGVPKSDLNQLFEPFARASNANVQDDKGLGLGLYITRQIIAGHGGTITVRSTEGEGTTFEVRLTT